MAVIHLITPEYLPHRGGVGDYTRAVARGLSEAGDDVHVWCAGDARGESGDPFSVHPSFGHFAADDLNRAGEALDTFPAPRRLLVQWVPHGFGYRAMNLRFCFWLWQRAAGGDAVELMVHEPYLAFWEGSWKQTAAAVVHRVMTMVLLRAARRVWVSIPAWETSWKPYALGRAVPFAWLPVPSNLAEPDVMSVAAVRNTYASGGRPLVGHLGTYGSLITPLLSDVLVDLIGRPRSPRVLLIGSGARSFADTFLAAHPTLAGSIAATGTLSDRELAAHVAACDVMIQPYPDGISSRRTTVMASLALGVPVITTRGRLSEGFWQHSGAVRLTEVGDHRAMAQETMNILEHADARRDLREAGRAIYAQLFDLSHTIGALRQVDARKAA